jgi:rubrerythrin
MTPAERPNSRRQPATRADAVRMLRDTLALEREATARYAARQRATHDPRLHAFWEGLRRNEREHRDTVLAALRALGASEEGDHA